MATYQALRELEMALVQARARANAARRRATEVPGDVGAQRTMRRAEDEVIRAQEALRRAVHGPAE
jgi:hypothetical protein